MEISAEEDHMFFIWGSKKTIDGYINNNDYHMAFRTLILVLEKLDTAEKLDFIDYYRTTLKPIR